jgi:mercuric ion transport protein
MMEPRTLAKVGIFGVIAAALCWSCFAPVLVLLLGVAGLSAYAGYLDYAIMPLMALFMAIMLFGLCRHWGSKQCCPPEQDRPDNGLGKEKKP